MLKRQLSVLKCSWALQESQNCEYMQFDTKFRCVVVQSWYICADPSTKGKLKLQTLKKCARVFGGACRPPLTVSRRDSSNFNLLRSSPPPRLNLKVTFLRLNAQFSSSAPSRHTRRYLLACLGLIFPCSRLQQLFHYLRLWPVIHE